MSAARILVVDDEEPLHTIIARVVARTGYEPVFARNGIEGLELAAHANPAVIVLDLRMPNMDGHTFLRRLAPLGLDASVVVTSGTGDMDDVIEVLRRGAVDYVRKPWDPTELRIALARAVEIHAARIAPEPTPPPVIETASTPNVFQELLVRIHSGEILLPSVPSIVEQLRTVVAGKATTLEAVTKLVAQDQALVTRVLQLGRSAMYASFKPTDLEGTIGRIGFQSLHTLAETVWLNNCFQARDRRFVTYTDRLARFGLARAVAMRALAKPTKLSATSAYLSGLLADVGASFLMYIIAEKSMSAEPESCLPFIRQHHASIGAQLLKRWGYATDVIELARRHHESKDKRTDAYVKLHTLATVTAADMVGECDLTDDSPASAADADACARALGIDTQARQRLVNAAMVEFSSLLEAR